MASHANYKNIIISLLSLFVIVYVLLQFLEPAKDSSVSPSQNNKQSHRTDHDSSQQQSQSNKVDSDLNEMVGAESSTSEAPNRSNDDDAKTALFTEQSITVDDPSIIQQSDYGQYAHLEDDEIELAAELSEREDYRPPTPAPMTPEDRERLNRLGVDLENAGIKRDNSEYENWTPALDGENEAVPRTSPTPATRPTPRPFFEPEEDPAD